MFLRSHPMWRLFLFVVCVAIGVCRAQPECSGRFVDTMTKEPTRNENGTLVPRNNILQFSLPIADGVLLQVLESPRPLGIYDSYNSTVVLRRDSNAEKYDVAKLSDNKFIGPLLRISGYSSFCPSADEVTVILVFRAGYTSNTAGYMIVDLRSSRAVATMFPIVTQGGVIVHNKSVHGMELWSTTRKDDRDLCQTCKKHYSVRVCDLNSDELVCNKGKAVVGLFDPDRFLDHPIAFEQSSPQTRPDPQR